MSWANWLPKSSTTTVSGSAALGSPRAAAPPGWSTPGGRARGVQGDLQVGLDLGVVRGKDAVAGVRRLAVDGLAALSSGPLVIVDALASVDGTVRGGLAARPPRSTARLPLLLPFGEVYRGANAAVGGRLG